MTKSDIAKIRKMVLKINATKQKIATLRDDLRNELAELNEVCESVTSGVDDIEAGIGQIEQGLDMISGLI